jgi:hypothetical protein
VKHVKSNANVCNQTDWHRKLNFLSSHRITFAFILGVSVRNRNNRKTGDYDLLDCDAEYVEWSDQFHRHEILKSHSGEVGKVKLSHFLINEALRHEDVWGSGCIDPRFLDLGTSWRWLVRFTSRSLYPRGKSPRYPLDRRLGGPQSRSGHDVEKRKFFTLPGLELRPLGLPARSQSLHRLRYPGT